MVRPSRSIASDSGASRRRITALRRRCCCPLGRLLVTRSAAVAGSSLRPRSRRYVPVRRFLTELRLPLLNQPPRQSYWMSETLLLRVLTTASYEKDLDFPSLLRIRLPVPRTRTCAFDADSVRASLANRTTRSRPLSRLVIRSLTAR